MANAAGVPDRHGVGGVLHNQQQQHQILELDDTEHLFVGEEGVRAWCASHMCVFSFILYVQRIGVWELIVFFVVPYDSRHRSSLGTEPVCVRAPRCVFCAYTGAATRVCVTTMPFFVSISTPTAAGLRIALGVKEIVKTPNSWGWH